MANTIRLNTKDISIVNLELCYLFALSPASCLRVHVNTVGTWPHCVCNICDWTEMYVLLHQVSSSCCFVHVSGCCSCNLNILCVYGPKFNSTWKVCTCLVCTCFVMYLLVSSLLLVAVLSTRGRLPRQLKLSLKRFVVSPELAFSTTRWLSHVFLEWWMCLW